MPDAARAMVQRAPLFPRINASPYLALSWPFTYSSVCSMAMFMKPSRHASTPDARVRQNGAMNRRADREQWAAAASLPRTAVVHARVELDHDWAAQDVLQEGGGVGGVRILRHGATVLKRRDATCDGQPVAGALLQHSTDQFSRASSLRWSCERVNTFTGLTSNKPWCGTPNCDLGGGDSYSLLSGWCALRQPEPRMRLAVRGVPKGALRTHSA